MSTAGRGEALRIVRVPGKGRGIRAGRPFAAEEMVDSAPVVVVSGAEWELVAETDLGRFCFVWDDERGTVAVALGRGSLFNHSYTPNVRAEKSFRGKLMRFYAVRDIAAGEELTINYNGGASRDPVGFDVVES